MQLCPGTTGRRPSWSMEQNELEPQFFTAVYRFQAFLSFMNAEQRGSCQVIHLHHQLNHSFDYCKCFIALLCIKSLCCPKPECVAVYSKKMRPCQALVVASNSLWNDFCEVLGLDFCSNSKDVELVREPHCLFSTPASVYAAPANVTVETELGKLLHQVI